MSVDCVRHHSAGQLVRISHHGRLVIRIEALRHEVEPFFARASFSVLPKPERILFVEGVQVVCLNDLRLRVRRSFSRGDVAAMRILDPDWHN